LPIISAVGLRQEYHEFQATVAYIARSYLKNQKYKQKQKRFRFKDAS
jgi:hypothetical protein